MSAQSTPGPDIPGAAVPRGPRRRGKGRRRKPRAGRRRGIRLVAWTAAGVVLLGGAGAGYLYVKFNGNLTSVDIDRMLGGDRPAGADDGSENILVIGSDSRSGDNRSVGGGTDDGTARSDTAMIVHVHEGHREASVVSIPRDTLVHRPDCVDSQGVDHPAEDGSMFNSAYSVGGAACAVKTVETLSGLRMDHYLEVDFSGFQRLIDDLGGVEITTTQDIHDPDSHLDLEAGTHRLDGEEALALVRTRHGVGDGSDLGRIQLQQAFVKALTEQVGSLGLLGDPTRLYNLADTATKSLTTDSDLGSVNALMSFAADLGGIGASDLTMITLPVHYAPDDPNRVAPEEDEAQRLWTALKADEPIPTTLREGSATGEAGDVITVP
ncbi:LCP family protein [Streptomyces sp. HSG2]|uniref:LCP family protein n=1 Tax=Streptomyces sp. HSG2 TaxID=2797167 RepID=UPI0019075CD8|nr:LCP family protein [Streptomyces sp. HSG2]